MRKLLLRDTSGKKSTTLTAFVIGFVVVNLKLLLSGMTLGGVTFGAFTGVEFAASVGALGGIYVLRRSTASQQEEEGE